MDLRTLPTLNLSKILPNKNDYFPYFHGFHEYLRGGGLGERERERTEGFIFLILALVLWVHNCFYSLTERVSNYSPEPPRVIPSRPLN